MPPIFMDSLGLLSYLPAFGSNADAHDQPSEKAAAALRLWPQNPRPNS